MSENNTEYKELPFLPEFANQIAEANNSWAYLEYYINTCIWHLADVAPALGACMTSQIYTLQGRLNALVALLNLRKADQTIIDRVNSFSSRVREASEARNRIAHDMWLNDSFLPKQMGKMEVTANKSLKFQIVSISCDELKAEVAKIHKHRGESEEIRKLIKSALPSLPELPPEVLHPIDETPKGR